MRAALVTLALAVAAPAAADGIPSAARWSLDVHDVGPDRSLDAVLESRRVDGGWRLVLTCETTDVKRRKVVARERHAGLGRRSADVAWVVEAVMDGGRSRITVGFPGDGPRLLSSYPGCPAGQGNLGTGD